MPVSSSRPLSVEETEAFGAALDALRQEVLEDLGARDLSHIRRVIAVQRTAELAGRGLLHLGIDPLTFTAGTVALSLAKILENMEIGHNVMHGQYDWTGDPSLDGNTYEWDNVCTGDNWRHYHNHEHHTYTNILGKDRDIGYDVLRVTDAQPWRPGHLTQPVGALALALLFQWGVGVHDLRLHEPRPDRETFHEEVGPFLRKAGWQLGKDYVLFPALALANAPRVLLGNLIANTTRNVWAFSVIFVGHFPEGVSYFTEEEVEGETRGGWYVRQLNGSVNFDGPRWVHVLSGHLSHQIEHHLFPDLPAHRYPELAPKVQALCAQYGQTYLTGSLSSKLRSVAGKIWRHAWPSRTASASRDRGQAVATPVAA